MKDKIDELIKELRKNREIKETKFANTFLNEVGKIYEFYGYGAAKTYLIDKLNDKKKSKQAKIILSILDEINKIAMPRDIGSFIIRKINSIKYYKGE